MFPVPSEMALRAIYVAVPLAVIAMAVFRHRELWSWIKNMAKASPKIIVDFCAFCRAVVLRLSNLLIGGAIGLALVFYNQFTGQPLPMNVFWSLVAVMFACACFGAWREQFLEVKKQQVKRPDFHYRSEESRIEAKIQINPKPDPARAQVNFWLRFRNLGELTAYDSQFTVHFWWIGSTTAHKFGSAKSKGRVAVNEPMGYGFHAWQIPIQSGSHLVFDPRGLAIKIEITSRAGNADGPICVSDFLFLWLPSDPGNVAFLDESRANLFEEKIAQLNQQPSVKPPSSS